MKQSSSKQPEEPNGEAAEIIKSLLNYPSLEKVFDRADSRNLSATRQKIQLAIDDLERVVRRGTKEDAEKAVVAVKALQITQNFLDELENLRQNTSK